MGVGQDWDVPIRPHPMLHPWSPNLGCMASLDLHLKFHGHRSEDPSREALAAF